MSEHALYRPYAAYLKETYKEKVYKLPVNLNATCPNRDGTKGTGGCIFCGAAGSGSELLSADLSVSAQLSKNSAYIARRYKAKKFIAYFQSFSNTYLPEPRFEAAMEEAARFENVVELAISTRPDCVRPETLEFLTALGRERGVKITIELGLQSANEKTLKILNRGHTLDDYFECAARIKEAGLLLCTHFITDLPWDSPDDVVASARAANRAGSDSVKCHALYVEKGTRLEKLYRAGLALCSKEAYTERTIAFLEHLNPQTVIGRLIGRVPEADSVTANWNESWWKVRDEMLEKMRKEGRYQGRLYKSIQKEDDHA